MTDELTREEQAQPLLMSLRPRFAHAILDGSKTVELRRTRVSALPGAKIIIYASAPVMSVVGTATLKSVDADEPNRLWRRHGNQVGITRAEFDSYLVGSRIGCALTVANPQELADPYELGWLRDHAGFRPPQSYRFLAQSDPEPLHALVKNR
ncbi:Predicted transcriptional regulator, contains an HTH and PUA-like domains [Actinopolyspora alba]|uniref:Predicted transcriptional regulator, contains an HTH and PUA-like domains n=1 Tax=Actinopolyspora alba TaxID=673379 RepID=A0A1I1Y9M5_9ACTN|nr:hypothetical protein [Actinopolyspora alba]SFE16276.1 Predicted transcriptional regulator, contains an HTH and PUA-like domains [Actinopolyspora alba]